MIYLIYKKTIELIFEKTRFQKQNWNNIELIFQTYSNSIQTLQYSITIF